MTRAEILAALAKAEGELLAWATGQRSYMNQMMEFEQPDALGQMGDRQLTFVRIAQRDAAEIEIAIAKVRALRLLLEGRPV